MRAASSSSCRSLLSLLLLSALNSFHARAEADIDDTALFFYVESPEKLRYSFQIAPAPDIGVPFPDYPSKSVQLIYAYPAHACEPLKNMFAFDKVILVERGECSFVTKALHAEEAGARAVIVTNSVKNDYDNVEMVSDKSERRAGIPVAYLIGVSGKHIRDYLLYGEEDIYITIPLNHTTLSLRDIPQKPPWELW